MRILPCAAGEVAAKPAEGASSAPKVELGSAPSTMLRMVPLPRFAGEEP